MATEVRLPGLGESISEGTIVRWLKQPGDAVARDEDLVLVQTDKIEGELPSPQAGVLLKILAEVGSTAQVGDTIALLGEEGEAPGDEPPAARADRPAVAPAPPPAAAPEPAPRKAKSAPAPAGDPTDADERNQLARTTGELKLFVSPVVRRLAREHDVNLGRVVGSGQAGRITRRDIEAFIADGGAGSGFVAPPQGYVPGMKMPVGGFAARVASPFDPKIAERFAPEQFEGDSVEPLSPLGRFMAEHMAYTWWRAPHVSTLVEVDVKRLADWRRGDRRFSYTLLIAHGLAQVLSRHLNFNSSLTHDHRRVTHRRVNLGIAVAKPDGGLVVPVIHGADSMSLEQLAEAFRLKVERARSGSLRTEDLSGGTFTITNVGSNGNLASMPLINQPQVGILAIGAIKKRVVVITDSWGTDAMAIRPMMYMTLTYDHRANDGAASGRFLRELRKTIELWPPGSEESGS